LKNEFNNLHVAIWDGTNVDAINSIYTPLNFKMTASYGTNVNDKFLNEKFSKVVQNSNEQNWIAIK
jgi:hypothetical protein